MIATVYTDGSWHEVAGLGAWGLVAIGVVRGQERRIERFGPTPTYCTTPMHTELAAIFAALVTLQRAFPGVEAARLYTDCRFAIELLHNARGPTDTEVKLLAKIRAVKLPLTLGWIPAQQADGASEHAPFNNQADLAARRGLAIQLEAHGFDLPRRRDDIRAMSPAELVELHDELRKALAKRFGGNGRGMKEARAWAWSVLGLEPTRSARVHDLSREQAETILAAMRSSS